MMSQTGNEEEPFQKIRITLSEVAIDKLAVLRTQGYFRSDSATVEECIRAIFDVVEEFSTMFKRIADNKTLSTDDKIDTLLRIGLSVRRFVPRPTKMQKT